MRLKDELLEDDTLRSELRGIRHVHLMVED